METTKLYLAVVLIRVLYAGMHVLSKAAFTGGMNTCVFVFYRQLTATLFLLPLAFILERKRVPPLPFRLCFKMFMLSLVGIAGAMNLFSVALDYTSAALSSATVNSIPVFTFIMAVLFRMETVKVRRWSGSAKIAGVGLCVAGVLTIAFYSGPRFKPLNHRHVLAHGERPQPLSRSHDRWVQGTFIMIASNLTGSLWLVLQGPLVKEFPSHLLSTTLQSLFSAVQTFLIALAVERDFSRWKLGFNVALISVAYCGIGVTGITFFLQSWVIQQRGPVFLTMTVPLTIVITMLLLSFLLGELVGLESILGGALMIGGLYSVVWGQTREKKEEQIPSISRLEEKDMEAPRETYVD